MKQGENSWLKGGYTLRKATGVRMQIGLNKKEKDIILNTYGQRMVLSKFAIFKSIGLKEKKLGWWCGTEACVRRL